MIRRSFNKYYLTTLVTLRRSVITTDEGKIGIFGCGISALVVFVFFTTTTENGGVLVA